MPKKHEREVALYGWLEEIKNKTRHQELIDLINDLRESLWQVLHAAEKPPGNEQEEFVRPSALADLEKGNTFYYCLSELERFAIENPIFANEFGISEQISQFKIAS